MGNKLKLYFDEVEKIGGMKAKMRLAMLTLIPSTIVETTEDSPENIKKFENAMIEIKKEFK